MIAFSELLAIVMVSAISPHDYIDGEVYRLGAQAWLNGKEIYDNLPATESGLKLPFIYPPFAAIVFAPLAFVPKTAAVAMIMVVNHLALLVTLYVVLSASTFLHAYRDKTLVLTAAMMPLLTISEPIRETMTYAQINIVLMVLVAVDCLWRTDGSRKLPYPRGMLIGIAAGLKLTPLVFLLFLLLRKDFRAIGVSIGTFGVTVAIGAALAFQDAGVFWFREMLASSNVSFGAKFTGDASIYAGNQSVRSLLSKLGMTGAGLTVVWVVLALAIIALAIIGMIHALRRNDLPMAIVLNAVAGLLVSPISWSHHWVWATIALVIVIGDAFVRRNWAVLVAAVTVSGFVMFGPHWQVPQGKGRELRWNLAEHFIGNSYVYFGLALLIFAGFGWWAARRRPGTPAPDSETPTRVVIPQTGVPTPAP